ncbi:MAG: 2-phospho-L-lactate transferase [Chloroflexi bacterium]|nr:2-phospho-L-lactate transferase [Chloroflexota bacterium]
MALDSRKNVVALVGGVGGAKLAHGLAQILAPEQLTIIVNTADDFDLYGLRICPDSDTIMYTLAGLVDKSNGWGIGGDTTHMLGALRRYGQDTWFRLGDQDMATHVLRTSWLRAGCTQTQVTARLAAALGVRPQILPMSDEPVATLIDTVEYGELAFQHYFVRYRWQPTVKGLRYVGAEQARLTPQVTAALAKADVILIAPSNPWLSVAPILAVPGMRAALVARPIPRVAVTPIIAGQAVKGPAAKLMVELGYLPSAAAVAAYYGDLINGFVYDKRDSGLSFPALRAVALDTWMQSEGDRVILAREILTWIEGF